jgi:hypothetical protein
MFRLLRVYLKGKKNLFDKLSHKRYMGLLSKANSLFDGCYTLKEIQYLNNKF